jgi:hypothetical protein
MTIAESESPSNSKRESLLSKVLKKERSNLNFEIHGAHFPIGRPLQDWMLEVQLNKAAQSKSAMSSFKLKVGRFLFFSNALLITRHCQESASSANDNRRS